MDIANQSTSTCPRQAHSPAFVDICTGNKFQPKCKRWDCSHCSREKARAFYAGALRELSGCRVRMLTLTHRHDPSLTIEQHWELHRVAWRRFSQLLWKYTKKSGSWRKPRYLRILERHQSGVPHAHVLFDAFLHRQPAQRLWNQACHFAYRKLSHVPRGTKLGNAKLTGSREGQSLTDAVRYAVKYLIKSAKSEAGKSREERKTRRYSSSRKLKLSRTCPIAEQVRYKGFWVRLPRAARGIAHLFLHNERVMIPHACHFATGDLDEGFDQTDGLLDCEPIQAKLWREIREKDR